MGFSKYSRFFLPGIAVVLLVGGLVGAVTFSQQKQENRSHAAYDPANPKPGDPVAAGTLALNDGSGAPAPGYPAPPVHIGGLTPGVKYKIVASGWFHYQKNVDFNSLTDLAFDDWLQNSDGCFCHPVSGGGGSRLDFNGIHPATSDGYNGSHTYTFYWTADTDHLDIYVWDTYYHDNVVGATITYSMTVDSVPGDTTAPSAPTNLTANVISATQINLSWTASTDNVGVTGYKIFRDGNEIGTVTQTSFQSTGLTQNTTYKYTVKAVDAAGNSSTPSNEVSAKTLATDATAPSIPGNLISTVISQTQINLSWNASTDNVGVTCYKVWRDGTLLTTLGNVTSYQDTGLTADTLYSYEVAACDAAGNVSGKAGPVQGRTQTITPPNTKLKFDVLIHGVGNAGDSANPNGGGGNMNLVHLQRVLRVEVLDGNDAVIASNPNGLVLFDTQSGSFKGVIDMGSQIPSTGTYGIRVKMTQSLKKLKIQAITVGTTNEIPQMTLVNGDVNDDNSVSINVADYNILLGCYSDFTPAVDCDSTRKAKADLNDDGSVNFSDLNLFLRELNTSTGQ